MFAVERAPDDPDVRALDRQRGGGCKRHSIRPIRDGHGAARLARGRGRCRRAVASAKKAFSPVAEDPNERTDPLEGGEAICRPRHWRGRGHRRRQADRNARRIDAATADTFFYFSGWATKILARPSRCAERSSPTRSAAARCVAASSLELPAMLAARKIATGPRAPSSQPPRRRASASSTSRASSRGRPPARCDERRHGLRRGRGDAL
jgi:hypothetical protein